MTLLIIRHAESVENADKYDGFYQDPRPYHGTAAHRISRHIVGLTPRGFRQALWLHEILPTLTSGSVRVYTSTYRRAIDTASIAYPQLTTCRARQTPLLDEQHYGDATYMSKRELFATFPDTAEQRRLQKHLWTAPGGGESLADEVCGRASEFIAIARSDLAQAGAVMAFTHQTTVVAIRSILEDLPLSEILATEKERKTPNAAIIPYELQGGRFVKHRPISPSIQET